MNEQTTTCQSFAPNTTKSAGAQYRGDTAQNVAAQSHLIDNVFIMLGADPQSVDAIGSPQTKSETNGWTESPPWVLCIEDDADFSLALKFKLEKLGLAVARAFEGLEGVKQAFTRPADAIILDFNLPNGQGDFVLRRLKANPLTKDIPVIVVTGVNDQTLEQRMMSLGAAQFLTKPLDFQKLADELGKVVEING